MSDEVEFLENDRSLSSEPGCGPDTPIGSLVRLVESTIGQVQWGANRDPVADGLEIGDECVVVDKDVRSFHTKLWVRKGRPNEFYMSSRIGPSDELPAVQGPYNSVSFALAEDE